MKISLREDRVIYQGIDMQCVSVRPKGSGIESVRLGKGGVVMIRNTGNYGTWARRLWNERSEGDGWLHAVEFFARGGSCCLFDNTGETVSLKHGVDAPEKELGDYIPGFYLNITIPPYHNSLLCISIAPPEDELQQQCRKFVNKHPCYEEAVYLDIPCPDPRWRITFVDTH